MVKDGRYKPDNCTARQKVAILIPFRDRESHLTIFLNHIHAFLMKQQLEYAIYVVEQVTMFIWNGAMIVWLKDGSLMLFTGCLKVILKFQVVMCICRAIVNQSRSTRRCNAPSRSPLWRKGDILHCCYLSVGRSIGPRTVSVHFFPQRMHILIGN